MNGEKFIDTLLKELGGISQAELAKIVGKQSAQLSAMRNNENLSAFTVARMIKHINSQVVRGKDLLPVIRDKLAVKNESESAALLGMTPGALSIWKNRSRGITARQIANAIKTSRDQAAREAHASVYRPIIELFPISPTTVGKKAKVFNTDNGNKQRTGLKEELSKSYGIYIFFDSRGRALYVGKAEDQTIWVEMNDAFNRHRNSQTVSLVKHPTNNMGYLAAHEKLRQPVDVHKTLLDIAAYFSAYEVEKSVINDFEALFIRAFPNDLLNFKIEKPGKAKRATRKGGKKKLANKVVKKK